MVDQDSVLNSGEGSGQSPMQRGAPVGGADACAGGGPEELRDLQSVLPVALLSAEGPAHRSSAELQRRQ